METLFTPAYTQDEISLLETTVRFIVAWTGPVFWGIVFFMITGWMIRLTLEIVRGALRTYYTQRVASTKFLKSVFVFGATLASDKREDLHFYGISIGGTLIGVTRGKRVQK